MKTAVQWLIHYVGQGVKLSLIFWVAGIAIIPFGLIFSGLDMIPFTEMHIALQIAIGLGSFILALVAFAVFALIVTKMLKHNPTREFNPDDFRIVSPNRHQRS